MTLQDIQNSGLQVIKIGGQLALYDTGNGYTSAGLHGVPNQQGFIQYLQSQGIDPNSIPNLPNDADQLSQMGYNVSQSKATLDPSQIPSYIQQVQSQQANSQAVDQRNPQIAYNAGLQRPDQNASVVPQDRTLSPQASTQNSGTQIYRDNNGNFFKVENGVQTHLSLADFQNLGLNEKFVQPGQTVALSQAQTGQSTATSGNPSNPATIGSITDTILKNMAGQGLTINPNVPITPQSAAEFMSFAAQNVNAFLPYAQKEIAPYYQTQLKLAADTLGKSLGYNEDQLLQQEKDTQTKYADTLKQIGVSAADQGFAQSGIRNLQEGQLATQTQNSLDSARQTLAYNSGNSAANFAQTYGSSNLPSPTITGAPRVISGQSQFDTSGPSSSLYTLNPDVYNGLVGSNQYAETSAEDQRASQLEGLYNQQQSLGSTQSLPALS